MSVRVGVSVCLLFLLSGTLSAAIYSRSLLWQIGGYPLPDLNELSGRPSPVAGANPAVAVPTPALSAGVRYQFQTGDPRETSTKAVPRNSLFLPQAVGLTGHWHELDLGVDFQQLYNVHEQYLLRTMQDTVGVWKDWDSRLESLSLQASLPVLREGPWWPAVRAGVGFERFRLVVDQVELQRKLLADGWQLGLDMRYRQLRLGLAWHEETVWNHWDTITYQRYGESVDTMQVWAVQPQQLHVLAELDWPTDWRFGLNLRWTEWSTTLLGLRDRMEAAVLVHRDLPDRGLRLHGGLCTSGSSASTGSNAAWLFQDEQRTWFVLAGVERDFGPFTAELKLADSHLGPGKYRKQLITQLAVSCSLPTR